MVCQESEASERLLRVDEHYQQIVAIKLLTLLKTNVSREAIAGTSASFERIEAYIEGHLHEDIDVESLARQSSMSLRSLYALFERHAGTTPRQYIRRLKLERIRACLSDPGRPVRSVTELALDYGFLHLGRFAEGYRQQFGELPSETLKRRG